MKKLCKFSKTLEEFENAINSKQVDINEIFGNDNNALLWATSYDKDDIATLLIEKGADLNHQTDRGESNQLYMIYYKLYSYYIYDLEYKFTLYIVKFYSSFRLQNFSSL